MADNRFKNTGMLVRFILKRDRIRIPVWLISILLLHVLTIISLDEMFVSEVERQALVQTMLNPAMTAMLGPAYGIDDYHTGAMFAHEMLLFSAVIVAIMSILLVSRHTRQDEEEGRIELIRSLPTGRLANSSATIIVSVITSVLLAITNGIGLALLGLDHVDLEGSLLFGIVLGAVALFFSGVTAVFAQLSSSSRGATGFSFAILITAYIVRAIGDIGNETLSLISPLGLLLRSEVYVNNYWWPVIVLIGVSILLLILASYLNSIRDLGAGFFQAKAGRKHATPFLKGPLGLGFRIQRGAIIAWAIGMFLLGASYGSILGDFESYFDEIEILQEMLPQVPGFSLVDQYIAMLMSIMAMLATIPPVIMLYKIRGEEKRNRLENILSKPISKVKLLGSYLFISVIVGMGMLSLTGIGLWAAGNPVVEGELDFGTVFEATMVYSPAVFLIIGVGVFLIGIKPKWTVITWVYITYSFFVVYLGELLRLPEWMKNISPFGHIPQLPVEEMEYGGIIGLIVLSIILTVLGFIGYRNRDIEG